MRAVDTRKHIDQVILVVDVAQAAGGDEALQGGHRLGADIAPTKQPVFPAPRDGAQGPLQVVGVDGDRGGIEVSA